MANGELPANIIELDDSVDAIEDDLDADLVALSIAASRAQNAAIRYEARTTSLKMSFSPSSSSPATRDQGPLFDAQSPRRHQVEKQKPIHERERPSCHEGGKAPNPRIGSPELRSPDGHYDANRVVQPRCHASEVVSPTPTRSSIPSVQTGEDHLSAVNFIALGGPYQSETAMSESRPQLISSAKPIMNAQKRRNGTSSADIRTGTLSRKERKMKEVALATRTVPVDWQSSPSRIEDSHPRDENVLLTTVFRTDIYPLIKMACSQNSGIRSKEQAHSVGRAVRDNSDITNQGRKLTCVLSSHRSQPRL